MNEVDQKSGRIKYFPSSHFARPSNIAKIPMFLDALGDKTCPDNINDIIECNNVAKYLGEGSLPSELEEEKRSRYLKQKGSLYRRVKEFFNLINKDNFILLEKSDIGYFNHDALFSLIEEHHLDRKVGIQHVIELWENINGFPQSLLYRKRLVTEHHVEICELITTNNKFAEFLIQYYFSREKVEGIYLPLEIYRNTILNMFKSYINQDSPKLDCLHYISESVPRYGLEISSELKLLAKNRYDELVAKERSTGNIIDVAFCVKIEVVESDEKLEEKDGPGYIECKYSAELIDSLIEKDAALAFFLRKFYGFADDSGDIKDVCTFAIETDDHISYLPRFELDLPIECVFLEKFGNREYDNNLTFRVMNKIVLEHIKMFEDRMVQKYNKNFEKEISLFFNKVIKEKHGVGGFIF